MADFIKLVENDLKKLETSIDKLTSTKIDLIKKIVNHIIKSGGKRVRPILVMLSSKLCKYRGDKQISLAAIIEFIHTATLLHDDVVDNAKTRRGSSTVNTIWGNETSVLVGDFLYSRSFELIAKSGNQEIMKTISQATTALSEGEILEIVKTADISTTEADYYDIIGNKTAVLFAVACEVGALLGNATQTQRKALREFGYKLGIAFQLKDDILDYTSYDEVLGKRVGIDLKEGKVTLPLIHALKSATEKERQTMESILKKKTVSQKNFDEVNKLIEKYGGIEYTLAATERYLNEAKRHLTVFAPSRYREAFYSLADYMLKREK